VLVESVELKAQAFGKLYKEYGREVVEKVVKYHLVHGGISRFEKFKYFHNNYLRRHLSHEEENELCKRYSSLVEKEVIESPWVPGAKNFLDLHYKKSLFFLVSGTPQDELCRIVEARNMSHYFHGIFGSPQKKETVIKLIMSKFNLNNDQIVMLGDSITEYEVATKTGIDFVAREHQPGSLSEHIVKFKDFNDMQVLEKALFL
jgi:phosphoglycolate phosphatase-like HAD superfamily hydrolase